MNRSEAVHQPFASGRHFAVGQVAKLAVQRLIVGQFRLAKEVPATAAASGLNLHTLMQVIRR